MKTLLEQAKEVKVIRKNKASDITEEQIDLAVAWAKDEITLGQMSRVLFQGDTKNGRGGNVLYAIATWLREGFRRGIIK